MILTLILGLIIGGVSVIFVTQNTELVNIEFLHYNFQSPIAFIIIVSILVGMLLAVIFLLPSVFKDYLSNSRLRKQKLHLERTLAEKEAEEKIVESRRKIIDTHLENRS